MKINTKQNLILENAFNLALQNPRDNLEVTENLCKQILKKEPNHPQANFFLGVLSAISKKFDIAKKLLAKTIKIDPYNSNAHTNLGNVLKELGEHDKAINCYEKAIQIQPNNVPVLNNLGNLLKKLEEYQKAKICYERIIQIQPNNVPVLNNLGNVLKELEEYKKAISCYEKAIEIQPNYAKGYSNLGNVLKELGKFEEAKNFYQMAGKYEPENLVNLYHLSGLDEKILNQKLKNKIYKIIKRTNSTKMSMVYGNFLLSKYELKANKYKNELGYLLKGHQHYFELEEKKFNKRIEYLFNILLKKKETISLNIHRKNIIKDNQIIKPIFIIGVPRCGSTLIEKVIASGVEYIPIGEETNIIGKVVENHINQKQSLNFDIEKLKKKIVEIYKQKGLVQEKSNYIFTDKTLENFFYIDIIKKTFPDAKIINCRRDTLSSIMSTLKNNLIFLAWTHNLEHIFKYYDIYFKIIKNFTEAFPNFIYDLEYEKFVKDPENESKKLMKFCGLPWDKKCLEFYKRRDLISKTTSNIQIRKPIYKDSINKYLPYKKFLSIYGSKYSWFA